MFSTILFFTSSCAILDSTGLRVAEERLGRLARNSTETKNAENTELVRGMIRSGKAEYEKDTKRMPKALSLCREGDKVYIDRVGGNGAFKKRLGDLGFRRGKLLSIVKYAPLKDPMEVELEGNHISLRVEEAVRIEVHEAE